MKGERICVIVLSCLVLFLCVSLGYEWFILQKLQKQQVGFTSSVGFFGDQMHIVCRDGMKEDDDGKEDDESKEKPLIVIHNGISFSSHIWSSLQSELQNRGISSCVYDRLGVGVSQTRTLSTTPTIGDGVPIQMMREILHLSSSQMANPPSSEIHIGYSLGGLQARWAAEDDRVVGLLFLDPTPLSYYSTELEFFNHMKSTTISLLTYMKYLAVVGLPRFLTYFTPLTIPTLCDELPVSLQQNECEFAYLWQTWDIILWELQQITFELLQRTAEIPNRELPCILLSSSSPSLTKDEDIIMQQISLVRCVCCMLCCVECFDYLIPIEVIFLCLESLFFHFFSL
jgi:pimeloyl-ACP methyl ester carboxylesterase